MRRATEVEEGVVVRSPVTSEMEHPLKMMPWWEGDVFFFLLKWEDPRNFTIR